MQQKIGNPKEAEEAAAAEQHTELLNQPQCLCVMVKNN